jgi:hypothetical protein
MAQKVALPRLEDFADYVAAHDKATRWARRIAELSTALAEARENEALEVAQREAALEDAEAQLAEAVFAGGTVQTLAPPPPSVIPRIERDLILARCRHQEAQDLADVELARAALQAFKELEPGIRLAADQIATKLLEVEQLAQKARQPVADLERRGFPMPELALANLLYDRRLKLATLGFGIGPIVREVLLRALEPNHPAVKAATAS